METNIFYKSNCLTQKEAQNKMSLVKCSSNANKGFIVFILSVKYKTSYHKPALWIS